MSDTDRALLRRLMGRDGTPGTFTVVFGNGVGGVAYRTQDAELTEAAAAAAVAELTGQGQPDVRIVSW